MIHLWADDCLWSGTAIQVFRQLLCGLQHQTLEVCVSAQQAQQQSPETCRAAPGAIYRDSALHATTAVSLAEDLPPGHPEQLAAI